jgi:hypothetical protein
VSPGPIPFFLRVWPYPARTGTYQLTVAVKSPGQFTFENVQGNLCTGMVLVNENAGSTPFNVVRMFGNFGPATVDFATRDVRALAGRDYVATNGTLTFASGQTRASFNVTILDDSEPEPIEGLGVDLTNPTGGAVVDQSPVVCLNPLVFFNGDPGPSQVLILDDDEAPNESYTNAAMLDVSLPVAQADGNLAVASGDVLDVFGFTNSVPGAKAWIYVNTESSDSSFYAAGDSQLNLWRGNFDGGSWVETDDDDGSQGPLSSAIAGCPLSLAGNYYIALNVLDPESGIRKVENYNTNALPLFNYRLFVVLTTNAPAPEVEPNNTTATANPILTSTAAVGLRSGTLAGADVDCYSVVAQSGDTLIVMADGNPERDTASSQTDTILHLLGPNGGTLFYADSSRSGGNPAEAFTFPITVSGTYVVRVLPSPLNGTSSTYQLLVACQRPFVVTSTIVGTDVRLSFPTLVGRNYRVEVSGDLVTWSPLSAVIPGTGGTVTYTDTSAASATGRFYRVAIVP